MMADTASHNIEWVARARWIVDGKFWTSSGVTAGKPTSCTLALWCRKLIA